MVAATRDLGAQQRQGGFVALPTIPGTPYYIGMLCGDKAGVATPVTADVGIMRIGVVRALRGPQGAPDSVVIDLDITKIYGPFKNSAAGDALVDADVAVGTPVYGVDNQTAAKTNGSGTRPWLGWLHSVTSEGVFFTKVRY